MARWFPRFASRIAFRCVLHPRESRDIRRRELFQGFSYSLLLVVAGTFFFFSSSSSSFGKEKTKTKKKKGLPRFAPFNFLTSKGEVQSGVKQRADPPSLPFEGEKKRGGLPRFASGSRRVREGRCDPPPPSPRRGSPSLFFSFRRKKRNGFQLKASMILPQVHLRKPCYDFSFL
jgi:hypothetical protein